MQIDDITLIKSLGSGAFGEVFLTKKQGYPQEFATKKMSKEKIEKDNVRKYFNNEIHVLKYVKHPNIIKLQEIKHTMNSVYIVMEYCNGGGLSDNLNNYKKRYGHPFTQEIVQHIMKQIVSGIQYLHSNNIIHRDIKLDNILLHYRNEEDKKNLNLLGAQIKIIDFGFARFMEVGSLSQSVLGSPINMDPHILERMRKVRDKNSFGYDLKADIWSLGTICYEMLTGNLAFDASNFNELLSKISKGEYYFPTQLKLSKEAISFMNGMLQYDSKRRLNIDQLACHYFLRKNVHNFTTVDLSKIANKINDSKIVVNIKESVSFLGVIDDENELNINNLDPNEMVDNDKLRQVQSSRTNELLIKDDVKDYLTNDVDDITSQVSNANINNNKQVSNANINNNNNNNNANNDAENLPPIMRRASKMDIACLIESQFEILNKDFSVVEEVYLPIMPGIEPSIKIGIEELSEDIF